MFLKYIITILIILGLLGGWVVVQHIARLFAARHPEFGPAREEGGGCGGLFCLCKDGLNCPKNKLKEILRKDLKK